MRPIKLVMKAFGPYKNLEVVDFRELNDKNLFLITGPTGAGKTTIFDAISFALYGEASGNMRGADSLRSHFSDDDQLTEVELEFKLREKRYHIHRIPKQNKPKARGEGSTEQKPEAILTIFDGEPNTKVVGVKNVNDKLEAVLGVNSEQFKQIMMIPQGEFQKLLTSDSLDRQRILQQLFDTSIYNTIQTRLEIQAKGVYIEIKKNKEIRDHEISKIEAVDNEPLKSLIEAEDKLVSEIITLTKDQVEKERLISSKLEFKIKETGKKIEKQIEDREKAKENNEKLKLLDSISARLIEKEQASNEITDLADKVKRAEAALVIVPIEENVTTREKELKNKNTEIENIIVRIEIAKAQTKEAEEIFQKESSPEMLKQRENYIEELTRLHSYEEKVKKIESITTTITETEKQCKKIETDKKSIEEFISNSQKSSECLSDKKDEAKEAEIKLVGMKDELDKTKETGKKLIKLFEIQANITIENDNFIKQEVLVKKSIEKVNIFSQQYKKSKLDYLTNQAAVLAKELNEGEPCPVCGATHHIMRATFSENAVTKEQLDGLEEQLKKQEEEYNNNNKQLAILDEKKKQLEAKKIELVQELSFKGTIEHQITENNKKISRIEKEVTILGKIAGTYEAIIKEIAQTNSQIKESEEKVKNFIAVYLDKNNKLSEEKTNLKNIYETVPEHIRNSVKLTDAIKEQERNQKTDAERFSKARKNYDDTTGILIAFEANKQQLLKDQLNLIEILYKANMDFNTIIAESNFIDIDEYKKAKLTKEAINIHKNRIELYSKEVHSLKQQFNELLEKTKDMELTDISVFEEQILLLRQENTELTDINSATKNRISNNLKIISEVDAINLEIGGKEAIYKIVGNLSNIAKGNNPAGITFERYVLAAFLDDIIAAANNRLNKMTNGRYKLSRTEERQRSNAQSGLELEVYDNYTGKSRHVKTLSGGEGFKASLSMALGLADVVQAYAGGVQLDTMFIDEGFGTLDQESLDSAISCLIDLQKTGRLVGIISHVQELKERIDTRLEVVSSSMGSETRFVVG